MEPDNLPKMLQDGEMVNLWLPPRAIAQMLREKKFQATDEVPIRAFLATSTGKEVYYSKSENVTISDMDRLEDMK